MVYVNLRLFGVFMIELLKSRRALRIYFVVTVCLAALCVLLRTLSTVFFFDADIGYYKSGAFLPILLNLLLVISVIGAAFVYLISKKYLLPAKATDTRAIRISAVITSLGFLAYLVSNLWDLPLLWDVIKIYGKVPTVFILINLAALLSAVYFLLIAFARETGGALRVVGTVFVLVFMALSISDTYFDPTIAMNSPIKMLLHFALLSAMLLAVNEARIGLGSEKAGFHLFSATIALIFTGASSIPSIVCYLTGQLDGVYSYLFCDIVLLGIAVFSAARLASLCFGRVDDAEHPDLEEIAEIEYYEPTEEPTEDTDTQSTDELS